MGALTLCFLGATTEKFARAKLSGELSLLADTGNIRQVTAVGRWAKTARYTFLLIDSVSFLFF